MNREEAKLYIQQRARDYLEPDKSKKGFICPICGSGRGKNGTGITTKDGIHFTCWAGCFSNADIIDIIGLEHGLEDYNSKLQAAASEFGVTIESTYSRASAREEFAPIAGENQNQPENEQHTQQHIHNYTYTTDEAEPDYTAFFLQANKDIGKTDYHRGLSLETLNRFKVGYVAEWKHPKATAHVEPTPRLIIPTSRHSYLARDTRAEIPPEQEQYKKSKAGRVRIFNSRALREAEKPIYVVEGELDALSIIEVGGEAVALGSIHYVGKFLAEVKEHKPEKPLIIALDNDTDPKTKAAVEKRTKELEDGLEKLGVFYITQDITGAYKDANEALMSDREALRRAVAQAEEEAQNREAAELEAEREQLKQEAVAYSLQSFIQSIEDSKQAAFVPTGFSNLDSIIGGGLYAGLYIVGAVSSLGKTTFCLQIADQIAQAGHDVLIFSLEMARNELIAKSVSRITLTKDLAENGSTAHAKTTRGILTGTRYKDYSQTERELIQAAITGYSEYAQHIYITEGVGDVGAAEIREKVERHVKLTGKAPVVVIDYLQIIDPADMRATDKQNTDKAVKELKRISRDYSIPVIGISSFNRDNYTAPVNMASFKESGAIEYSSDCLLALQYEGMDYREGEADKAREKRIRGLLKKYMEDAKNGKPQPIQLKVLKQRNGPRGEVQFDFYPMFNYFKARTNEESGEGESGDGWSKAGSDYK